MGLRFAEIRVDAEWLLRPPAGWTAAAVGVLAAE